MKKVISILLALTLALSVCSVAAFADTAPATKTDALFEKLANTKELQVSVTPDSKFGMGFEVSDITVYIKDDNIAVDTKLGFLPIRAALLDKSFYAYCPSFPFAYISASGLGLDLVGFYSGIWELIDKSLDAAELLLAYVKSYEENVNGTIYSVEEYNDREYVTTKFYYQGDVLKFISVYDSADKSTQITTINSYSFSVDDGIFKKPVGIDITKLLKLIGVIEALPLAA